MRLAGLASVRGIVVILTVIGCVASAIYALHLGQDVNYDQMAYHYESAHEYLADRITVDASPEGLIHAYFNPLAYVPFYLMVQHLPPAAVLVALGFVQGLNLGLVLSIAVLTTGGFAPRWRPVLCAGALLMSLASPMALSEVGTSMSDITTSLFVLSGLALIIAAGPPRLIRGSLLLIGLGSCLVGIAIGLKLTNMLFAAGVAACCAIGWQDWRGRLRGLLAGGVGGACGVLIAGGPWSYRMWTLFRSPVFPYYDALFRSPEIDSQSWLHGVSYFDNRFMPRTMLDALALPFRWTRDNQTTAELGFRDIRFAVLACLLAVAFALAVAGLVRGGRVASLSAAQRKLLTFFLAGFACWMAEFSIQRYLVVLELLMGPVLVIALGILLRGRERVMAAATLGLALLSVLTVQPPSWGRVKPLASWYDVRLPPALREPGLVFLQGPISFVAPFLPPESRVVGLGGGPVLRPGSGILSDRVITAALTAVPALPAFVIADDPMSADTRDSLGRYGLQLTGPCWKIPNRANHVSACALSRMAAPGPSAAILRPAQPVVFDDARHGLPFLMTGWEMDGNSARIGADFDPRLEFRLDPAFGRGPVRLVFQIAGMQAIKPGAVVTVLANDHVAAVWPATQPAADGTYAACIPAEAIDAGRVVVLRFRYGMPQNAAASGAATPINASIALRSLVADPVAACSTETATN